MKQMESNETSFCLNCTKLSKVYVDKIINSRAINWVNCSFGEESMKACIHTPNNILFEISRGHKLDLSAFVRICPECMRTEGLFTIIPKLVEMWQNL